MDRLTTELRPNTYMRFEYAPDGEFMAHFQRLPNAGGDDALVGFANVPALESMFSADRSVIRASNYRFENLGYNVEVNAYVGRLMKPEQEHG